MKKIPLYRVTLWNVNGKRSISLSAHFLGSINYLLSNFLLNSLTLSLSLYIYVCLCVRERERERERMCYIAIYMNMAMCEIDI